MIVVYIVIAVALLLIAGRLDARWRDFLDGLINKIRRRNK
jgi:hypothetical protein